MTAVNSNRLSTIKDDSEINLDGPVLRKGKVRTVIGQFVFEVRRYPQLISHVVMNEILVVCQEFNFGRKNRNGSGQRAVEPVRQP